MRPPPSRLPPWRLFFPAAALGGIVALVGLAAAEQGRWMPADSWSLGRWHAHEMLFGHVVAAFAGVLLTALPRWTGCPPMPPATTLMLFAAWLAARAAAFGLLPAPFLWASPLFVFALAAVAGRRILAARDRRDAGLVACLAVLGAADVLCLRDPVGVDDGGLAVRLGLAGMVGIATVMSGRVAPALTRHLASTAGRDLVVAVPRPLEIVVAIATAAAFAAWVFAAPPPVASVLLAAAALFQALRIAHWRGWTARRRPSILALHVGAGFIALGFALLAVGVGRDDPAFLDAGRHAWGVGVLGVLCLAVQASVVRRHGHRPLERDRLADVACLALGFAAFVRLGWSATGWEPAVLLVAVALWLGAQGLALLLPWRTRPAPEAPATAPSGSVSPT